MTQRISTLVEINQVIAKELGDMKAIEPESHNMIEESAPEEKILESIFSKRDFKYHLGLRRPFTSPLYKDRNFNLSVGIYDEDNKPMINNNTLELKFDVYTSTLSPEQILVNKQNQPILKGNASADLTQGSAFFQKLSIREVSSKFERGLVTLVVSVRNPPFEQIKDGDIDCSLVRPLLLRDIMIRAKKT